MRSLLLCVLMVLVPLASAISSPAQIVEEELEPNTWHEVVLVSSNQVWTTEMWNDVAQNGAFPLRVISSNELLVWQKEYLLLEFDYYHSEVAEWKSELTIDNNNFEYIKILFEPRLPTQAYAQIENDLLLNGIEDFDSSRYEYSVMPQSLVVKIHNEMVLESILAIPGILWIEPVLQTEGRNLLASAYMSDGNAASQPQWEFGLNGEGVILGVADSGLDIDHSCFRNASDSIGDVGLQHRKVVKNNITIDDGDNPGEMDYRHGTHVAGSLVCHDVYSFLNQEKPQNATTISYASKLVFQDIVSDEGWVPPENVSDLLLENTLSGGIIHSNSWGDDTTAYTDRTADFDHWALEVPWSLSFIAPGNTGGQLLEPANGRNVVAIGATTKSANPEIWQSSSTGPTEAGGFGIFAVAPGVSINSAKADGFDDSMNNALRASSGTSMATPIAASFTGIIQQMVEQGWILSSNEVVNQYNLSTISPSWSALPNESIGLGEGFTPSGPLLRSLLAIATKDITQDEGYFVRNNEAGWGVLSLEELIDFGQLETSLGQENLTPTSNVWIHDSFRNSFDVGEWLTERIVASSTGNIADSPWNGGGAEGPFLGTGEVWTKRLVPTQTEDFEVVLSFAAKPEPFLVDDLRLVVKLSDGDMASGGVYDADGFSSIFSNESLEFANIQKSNETSVSVKIPMSELVDISWLDIEVHANYVAPGNTPGSVGVDGDRVGFALAAKGVIRDSQNWEDSDGDGIANAVDLCPNQHSQNYDLDLDGCPDDTDGDGIDDQYDLCPSINSQGYDSDLDGCIDDSDSDGVGDNIDLCFTEIISLEYPVDNAGCRPIDSPISIAQIDIFGLENQIWSSELDVRWKIIDDDFDPYLTGARIMINQTGNNSFFPISTCTAQDITIEGDVHKCSWNVIDDLPIFDVTGFGLHVQFFAQSLNQSPEANNALIYYDSEIYFSVDNYDNTLTTDNSNPGAANSVRSLGWGIITIFSIALICRKLWSVAQEKDVRYENGNDLINNPFIDQETE